MRPHPPTSARRWNQQKRRRPVSGHPSAATSSSKRSAEAAWVASYDPKLQREVALKEVRNSRLDGEETQRLIVEARAMAKLSHPNVVAIYDVEQR